MTLLDRHNSAEELEGSAGNSIRVLPSSTIARPHSRALDKVVPVQGKSTPGGTQS
jgi:hypothetical protein